MAHNQHTTGAHKIRNTNTGPVDSILLGVVLLLLGGGLVIVYSASVHTATVKQGFGMHYLVRNGTHVFGGLMVMWLMSRCPYHVLQKLVPFLVVFALASMILLVPLGHTAGRATRWYNLQVFMFQPSELAKLIVVIYMAHVAQAKAGNLASFWEGYLPPLFIAFALMGSALIQPDFGSAVIIGFLVVTMLFVSGTRVAYVAGTILIAIPGAIMLILNNTMRGARLYAFLDPWAHRHDAGYQTVNSLAALANGGLTGVGLGQGEQKVGYIPEAQTDFVTSVLGEELGLVGTLILLVLYLILASRGIRAARRAPDRFGQALGFGIVLLISIQVLVNVGVAYGTLPTKGLTLPLISYGGTNMIVTCCAVGILLHLSRNEHGVPATLNPQVPEEQQGAVPLNLAGGAI
jgi:cell division protein FtsW